MKWECELDNCITTTQHLKQYTNLPQDVESQLNKIIHRHPMKITPYYISLIDWDNPNDPIKKMSVPSTNELNLAGSYDTSGELNNTVLPGVQHKYQQTALILATNRCATYCRHCFRKRLIGTSDKEILKRFEDAVNYINKHKEINNVLITGGDPFVLSNNVIYSMLDLLTKITHLSFIRFGTRTLVTLPSRFDDEEFLEILNTFNKNKKRTYVVTQFNYPREITSQAKKAINSLIKNGILINNQTVLLKGVNDYPKTLAKLLNKLVRIGVNPYYVFQCRPVKRVKNQFQIPLYKGIEITETAKQDCNGLSKRFKYIMSHKSGKIEILGVFENKILFKYHQAKEPKNLGKIFTRPFNKNAKWFDDLKRPRSINFNKENHT